MNYSTYKSVKKDYLKLIEPESVSESESELVMMGGKVNKNKNENNRIKKYYESVNKLAYLSDQSIKKLISSKVKEPKYKKWGITLTITIKGTKYFVKIIPVAELFTENQYDSKNLYNLPAHYNYGFGSAGINPWRELMMHIKTTNFVLENQCENFPLMYHHRIIDYNHNDMIETGLDENLMAKWDNDKNIENYLKARSESKYKIVLFLEYIPHVLGEYVQKHMELTESFYKQANKIIDFLHDNQIHHNDAHNYNYLVDDNNILYLTDFGLVLDKDFDLDKDEIEFWNNNKKLDYYYLIDCIFSIYFNKCYFYDKVKKKYGLDKLDGTIAVTKYLLDNIDVMKKEITLTDYQVKFIKKNSDKIYRFIVWKKEFKNGKNKKYIDNILTI